MNLDSFYLTGLDEQNEWCQLHGLQKTLLTRRLTIHIKHVLTEIFVRKTVDISKLLEYINFELFDYVTYVTNRLRSIYKINRAYRFHSTDELVKTETDSFIKLIELYKEANPILILDFDGVITNRRFQSGYNELASKIKIVVVTANPTVTEQYFINRELAVPHKIFACKGKQKKILQLKELGCRYPICIYIDNEKEYLEYGWMLGLFTYHLTDKLKWFSLKDKK